MEEWKEYKLGDLFERVTRKNTTLESENVLTISAQYGLINQEEFFNKSVAGKNLKSYYLLKKGEFAYNKSYSTGYPMGATKMLEKYEEGIVSTLYICFKSKSDLVDNEYFKYYFESKPYYDELAKIVQEGARNHGLLNVSVQDFFNINVNIPPIKEQKRIVRIMNNLDSLLNLHSEKFNQLKTLKDILLDKVLKKEILFGNGKWTTKNIEEICDIATGKSNTQDQVENGEYPFYIRSEEPVRSNKYLYDCEAVLTIGDGKIGKVFHYVNGKFDLHQRVYKMDNFKEIRAKYFYYYFSKKFYYRAMKMSAKGTVDSVRYDMIAKMKIEFPNFEEQDKIIVFFQRIDKIIMKEKEYIEQMKKIKCFFKQKLLTGKVRIKI